MKNSYWVDILIFIKLFLVAMLKFREETLYNQFTC